MYIIVIITLVSLVKIENKIQYNTIQRKIKIVVKHDIIPKKWVVRVIFKYYSIAKITFRIILVLSQINPKMIQVVKSHGPSGPVTRSE